jgi:glutaredoxin
MLTLYSTSHCHLCEQAYQLLVACGVHIQTQVIDVAEDNALFKKYGTKIPVLRHRKNELLWPFNEEGLKEWLKTHGIN